MKILSHRDGPRMLRMWYGPLADTSTLEAWQAEHYTPRTFLIFGIPVWSKRVDVESLSIMKALWP